MTDRAIFACPICGKEWSMPFVDGENVSSRIGEVLKLGQVCPACYRAGKRVNKESNQNDNS